MPKKKLQKISALKKKQIAKKLQTKKNQQQKWVDRKERDDFVKKEENKDRPEGDDDIYEEEERKEQLEDDEIKPEEAGFVEGYEDTEEGICSTCGKEIDPERVVEKETNGKMFTFCSQKCADYFNKRKAGLR